MTEKQYAPTKTEKKVSQKVATPKTEKPVAQKTPVEKKDASTSGNANAPQAKPETEGKEKKQPVVVKKVKKDHAIVNSYNVHISTKYAMAICKFIKGKTIEQAIADLEQVMVKRKAVPMKGEIPHRKGKMMSGRYPVRASEKFVAVLKTLRGNVNANDMDEPIISEAIANYAPRPLGRFGAWQRKRTHLMIKASEKKSLKKKKSKK